jgi:hypothetical protein
MSHLIKRNSFKLLEAEQEADFFSIPEMPATLRIFRQKPQSKADMIEANIRSSLRTYQSTGNMLDMFFGGMFNTAVGMTGGSMSSPKRNRSPEMDNSGKYR